MLARSRRSLVAGLVVTLVAALLVGWAAVAQAAGTSSPVILSPASSDPQYAGFSGPFEVDFSDSPTGDYEYRILDTADQTVAGPTTYTWTGSGGGTASLSTTALAAGSYTFRLEEVASTVPAATLAFTVRSGARPTCSVSVPRAVRVNAGQEIVQGRLGTNCAAAHVTYASWDVRHLTHGFHDLMTFDHTTRDTFSFFGADPLGTYVIVPTAAYNAAADDIGQNTPRIDLRLDSRLRLSAKRVRKYVTLTARLTKFVRSPRRFGTWTSRPVTLSYRTCGTCAWHVLRTRSTGAHGVATFKVKAPKARRYRVTSTATSAIWAPYAAYVRR